MGVDSDHRFSKAVGRGSVGIGPTVSSANLNPNAVCHQGAALENDRFPPACVFVCANDEDAHASGLSAVSNGIVRSLVCRKRPAPWAKNGAPLRGSRGNPYFQSAIDQYCSWRIQPVSRVSRLWSQRNKPRCGRPSIERHSRRGSPLNGFFT